MSSNTAIAAAGDPGATSLSRMLAVAKRAATNAAGLAHHFAVLQCPMNLHEAGAALVSNTGPEENHTLLDEAMREGTAVLVNRPLNAMPSQGGGVVRLADVPMQPSAPEFDAQRDKVARLEEEYREDLAPEVQHGGQGMLPSDFFRWADELG
ncbi:MAG: hypothetical protein H0X01_11110, partial [Nitrospira sp.]|nr:hypothetical protein [Nitrospira sp.]